MFRSAYAFFFCAGISASFFLLSEVANGAPPSFPSEQSRGEKKICQYEKASVQRDLKVTGWSDRDYDIYLPPTYDCDAGADLVIAFHGGFGNKQSQSKVTCPDGNPENPDCLQNLATQAGFVVVMPNGSRQRRWNPRHRSFNAGGGTNAWNCVGGPNCEKAIDDVAYFKALLGAIRSLVRVRNVYLTGISDGAAMCYRIACEMPTLVRAIAPVAGENQFLTTKGTSCGNGRVSLLDFHGDADPCWKYDGGSGNCGTNGRYISVSDSVAGWASAQGCGKEPKVSRLPQVVQDGTNVQLYSYAKCKSRARVEAYRIEGGGHTWPRGDQYAAKKLVGVASRNLDASRTMLKFFADESLKD